MAGSYNFHKDLARAEDTEKFVVDLLAKHFGKSFISAEWGGASKFHDIKLICTFLSVHIELKEDFGCAKYGNIAIEVESRGKPSGLTTSRSKFWLIMAHLKEGGRKLLSIRAQKLREMIDEKKYVRYTDGGDRRTSKLYLFKLEVIEDAAHLIWEE